MTLEFWRVLLTKRVVEESIVVRASAAQIFDLLATPSKHPVIDGSSSVKATIEAPERLSLGAEFRMDMKIGAKYKITNKVVEFDEGRVIAWRHFGGHIWRYEISEGEDGTARVTEQFDYRSAKSPLILEIMGAPKNNRRAMAKTLQNLKAFVEEGSI